MGIGRKVLFKARNIGLVAKKEDKSGASQVAQWVKVIAAKPSDLSSMPGTCVIEGKSQQLPQVVL